MADAFDINEEYERVFGKEIRDNLFSPDDEDYRSLRHLIIDAKREFNFEKSLPFKGVTLMTYKEYERAKIACQASAVGYRIFYIRKYVKNELATYAAGYFNPMDSLFTVLKGAFFNSNDYCTSLVRHYEPKERMKFWTNYQFKKGVLTQRYNYSFASASLAASCFLGKKCTFREWTDDRNRTLDAYYAKYKSADIYDLEDKTFPDYASPTNSAEIGT